jgi:hypothetical protein
MRDEAFSQAFDSLYEPMKRCAEAGGDSFSDGINIFFFFFVWFYYLGSGTYLSHRVRGAHCVRGRTSLPQPPLNQPPVLASA